MTSSGHWGSPVERTTIHFHLCSDKSWLNRSISPFVIQPSHESLQREKAVVGNPDFDANRSAELHHALHSHGGQRVAQFRLALAGKDAHGLGRDIGESCRISQVFNLDDVDDSVVGVKADLLIGAYYYALSIKVAPYAIVRIHVAHTFDFITDIGGRRIAARCCIFSF